MGGIRDLTDLRHIANGTLMEQLRIYSSISIPDGSALDLDVGLRNLPFYACCEESTPAVDR